MSEYEAVTLDSNVWYHLTEARVDEYDSGNFTSSFQVEDDNGVAVWGFVDHYWQFQPVDDGPKGRYALRCSRTGVFKQLTACYAADEIDDSKTQPCMVASDGTKAQMWDVSDWGNQTYRFVNVQNGSDYVMDVHPGNPPFMSSDLRDSFPQPGRHWLMTSVSDVDDGAYSTVFTKVPSSTATDASTTAASSSDATDTASDSTSSSSSSASSSSSSSSSISTGAAAGIGIGVGIAVLGLGLGLFFFWWRRRNRNRSSNEIPSDEVKPAPPASESYSGWQPPQEMSTDREVRSELDSTPMWASTVGTRSPETLKSTPVPESTEPYKDGVEGNTNIHTGNTYGAH